MFMIWFTYDSNLYLKINLDYPLLNQAFLAKMAKNKVLTISGWYPIVSHIFPKEGEMVLVESNQELNVDFIEGPTDLKKDVFINLRKQIRQKREGICASQI